MSRYELIADKWITNPMAFCSFEAFTALKGLEEICLRNQKEVLELDALNSKLLEYLDIEETAHNRTREQNKIMSTALLELSKMIGFSEIMRIHARDALNKCGDKK